MTRAPHLALALALALIAACSGEGRRPVGALCDDNSLCESGVCGGGRCLTAAGDDDGDTLSNEFEARLGSDPTKDDTDGDGLRDDSELAPDTLAALDGDGDGIPDILESAQADADGDCIPDQFDAQNDVANGDLAPMIQVVCSHKGICASKQANLAVSCATGTAVCVYTGVVGYANPEASCDGFDENCDGHTDEGFPDRDHDGVPDCTDHDGDNDGVGDAGDNCPATANADQADQDGDGIGDACVGDYHLAFEAQPGDALSGKRLPPVAVRLLGPPGPDGAPAVATRFHGTVTLALALPATGSTLGGTNKVDADAGVATFDDLSVTGANTNLALTASSGTFAPATSDAFTITDDSQPPAPVLDHFDVAFPPGAVLSGQTVAATVTARDATGKVFPFVGVITIVSDDPLASIPSAHTFVLADEGVVRVDGFVFHSLGARSVTVTSATPLAHGTGQVQVAAAPGAHIVLGGLDTFVVAGSLPTVTIDIQDENGVPVTDYHGSFSVTTSDPRCPSASPTMTLADHGHLAVGVPLETAGLQTVTVSGDLGSERLGTLVVARGPANHLVLGELPATVLVGEATTLSVDLQDDFGNSVLDYRGVVDLSTDDPQAVFPSTVIFDGSRPGAFGVDITFRTPGQHTINATDGVLGDFATTTALAGPPDHLHVTANVFEAVAGAPFELQIAVVDAHDFPTGQGSPFVSIGSPFGCDIASVTLQDGAGRVPDFHCTAAGLRTINATAGLGNALAGQLSLQVRAASTDHLALDWTPHAPILAGLAFPDAPLAYPADRFGNLTPTPLTIHARLARNAARARLKGPNDVFANGSAARFDPLALDRAGHGYVLEFAPLDGSLAPVASAPFDVVDAAPTLDVTPTAQSAGCAAFDLSLAQPNGAPLDLDVSFTQGGETKHATLAGLRSSTGLVGARSSPGGTHHQLVWNAAVDLPRQDANDVTLTVTATTPDGQRAAKTSQVFSIANAWHWTYESVPAPSSSDVVAAAVGDLDRDGRDDLVRLTTSPPQVLIELGAPDGFTSYSYGPLAAPAPVAVLLFDVDEDGMLDFVVGDAGNALHLYRVQRQFGQPYPFVITEWPLGGATPCPAGAELRALASARLGPLQPATVAVACTSPDGLAPASVHFYAPSVSGSPLLLERAALSLPASAVPTTLALTDLDKDGALDAVVGVRDSAAGPGVHLFRYALGAWSTVTHVGGQPTTAIAIADLDRDGRDDLVVADASNALALYVAADGYASQTPLPVDPSLSSLDALLAADLDDDGVVDLAVGSRKSDAVAIMRTYDWLAAAGDAAIDAFVTGDKGPTGGVVALAARDFRQSGHRDLAVVRGYSTKGVRPDLLRPAVPSPCDPLFAAPSSAPIGTTPSNSDAPLIIADVDGDGRLDATYLRHANGPAGGGVLIAWGDGAGGFRPTPLVLASPDMTREAAYGDFDGDGDLDLALLETVAGTGAVRLYRQDGPTTWVAEAPFPGFVGASKGLLFDDFDLDGRADILFVHEDPANETAFIHLVLSGASGFSERPAIAVGALVAGIAAADLNHDGALDLAVQRHTLSGPDVSTCLVRSNGADWPLAVTDADCVSGAGAFLRSLAFRDLDHDGTPELVAVAEVDGADAVYVRALSADDSATFATDGLLEAYDLCPEGAHGIVFADLDGDRREDAIARCATTGAHAVQVFRHAASGPRYAATADLDFGVPLDRNLAVVGSRFAALGPTGPDLLVGDTLFHLQRTANNTLVVDAPDQFEVLASDTATAGGHWVSADFDGDGHVDFAAADGAVAGQLDTAISNAQGGFELGTTDTGMSDLVDLVAAGDVTGDGRPDLVTTTAPAAGASWIAATPWTPGVGFQSGSGVSFSLTGTPTALAIGPLALFAPNGTVLTDDGRQKVIVGLNARTPGSPGALFVVRWDEPTSMWVGSSSQTTATPLPDDVRAVGSGRFRADLADQIAVAGNRAGAPVVTLARLEQCGPAPDTCVRATSEYVVSGFGAALTTAAAFGDIDGDGDGDVVLALADPAASDARVLVLRQSAPGTFSVDATAASGSVSYGWVGLADLDQSGRADILALTAPSGPNAPNACPTPEIALRDPSSSALDFRVRAAAPTHGGCPSGLAVFDIDGDGRPDLLSLDQLGFLRPLYRR